MKDVPDRPVNACLAGICASGNIAGFAYDTKLLNSFTTPRDEF